MSNTTRHTPDQWQQLVEQYATSGLTQKDFCQQHNIRPATFGYWRGKLSASDAPATTADRSWLDLSTLSTPVGPPVPRRLSCIWETGWC